MLTQSAVDSVYMLAKKLADEKIVLNVIANTPVSVLVNACHLPSMDLNSSGKLSPDANFDFVGKLIEGSTTAGPDGIVPHDRAMEDSVGLLSKAIQGNIDLARNVVKPMIVDVVKGIEDKINVEELGAATPLTVLPRVYHKLWDNVTFQTMFEKYDNTPTQTVKLKVNHPDKSPEELETMVLTGVSRLDGDVKEWLKEKPADFLSNTYKYIFQKDGENDSLLDYFVLSANANDSAPDYDRIIAIFLLTGWLQKNTQDGINMSAGDYEEYLVDIYSQAGRALQRATIKRNQDIKMKNLVISYPSSNPDQYLGDGFIMVNMDVYNTWLEEGGSPEVLMGAAITSMDTSYAGLLEKAAYYKDVWKRQLNIIRNRLHSQRFERILIGIRNAIATQINQTNEEQLPTTTKGALHERLNQYLKTVTINDTEDVYALVKHCVCHIFFAHTNAKDLLDAIDVISNENKGMDIREAALLAVIDIVTDWGCSLFTVERSTI